MEDIDSNPEIKNIDSKQSLSLEKEAALAEEEKTFKRSDYILLSQLAEQTERFDEMIIFVKKFISLSENLPSPDERYYFTTAYKNAVGNRRAELRFLTSAELKEQRVQNKSMIENIKQYKAKIENELTDLCNELIDIINEKMLPMSKDHENTIYYKKMKADYLR